MFESMYALLALSSLFLQQLLDVQFVVKLLGIRGREVIDIALRRRALPS